MKKNTFLHEWKDLYFLLNKMRNVFHLEMTCSVFFTLKQVKSKHCSLRIFERVALRGHSRVQAWSKKGCRQQDWQASHWVNVGRKILMKKTWKVNVAIVTTELKCGATDYTLEHAQSALLPCRQSAQSQILGCLQTSAEGAMQTWGDDDFCVTHTKADTCGHMHTESIGL